MKRLKGFLLGFSLAVLMLGCGQLAVAADMGMGNGGSVTILSPKDGAVLDGSSDVKLTYNVHLSPTGNHLHVYVDDQSPVIDRDVSGCPCSLDLGRLSPGPHEVDVKEATVHHVLTGIQSSVKFTVK